MAKLFHLFHRDPTVTSSPSEVRMWIEELDYSFLVYGEKFERAEINGERLLNITRQRLNELGIVQMDHQDIILKAITNIYEKNKVEEQHMQEEDQNDKKMPTRFGKQSEHLEHAIDRVLVMISERRRARSLHGTNEQPPHNIFTAALELINVVKMILNILERPPFDCMSEFSNLKNHLIKHITLLKHFSEQSDLSHEMESDMIDVCKGVTKICHYIIALPPDLLEPETQIPEFITPEEKPTRVHKTITIEPEAISFSMQHEPDYMPPIQHPSMLKAITSSPSELVLPLQTLSLSNERVPDILEYFSPERLNDPRNEGAIMMQHKEENKSETEASGTKGSNTSVCSLDNKNFQNLTIIESGISLMDSGSERCEIDSDSDRGIGLDYDLEQHWNDSDSVIWEADSDSEKCPRDIDSVKNLLETENYNIASDSVEDLMELEQHLVGVEQCKVDSDSLKHWMDSGSEKCLIDSDSEQYLMDSDNGTQGIDSDSEKCPIACASIKILQKEKHQMASDSVKRLMESEKILIETEKLWMVSASETYVRDSNTEKGGMDSASASGAYQTGKEKHPHKTESKRHVKDSNSEPFGMYSDSEKYELASAAVKHLMDTKTFQMSTDTEGLWVDSWSERLATNLDSKSLEMASDSVKHTMKSESCQRASDLDTVWLDLSSKSKKCWMDSEGEQLDFDYSKCWDNARIYQNRSARLQYTSESQDNFQKHWDNFDRHQVDSNSRKHQINSENERHINEFESKRHLMELEREQCLIQFENERLQMNEKGERHFTESDSIKEHRIRFDNERHHFDSKSEAQRLGARKKDNRPQGFWRPVFFPLPLTQGKGTEEQHSVQQMGNSSISKIQLVRYLSDDKTVRVKEVSPTLSDKQDSQPKLKEKHNHNISLDPDRLMINKHHRKPSHKVTVFKSHCKDYTYLQSFQSSESQMNPIHLLSGEDYTSDISASVCHPNSLLPRFVAYPKTHRNNTHSLDTGAQICPKCLMEISDSLFHKCLTNSDHDSDPDCPLHVQIPLDSKYSLSSKYVRYHKTSRNSPLSQSLDPKHPVGVHCPLHWEDSKYSLCSIYLYCESCSALQNLIGLSSTCTFPMNAPNTMDHHSISGPDSVINISNAVDLESENKFNITAKPKNEANHDSKIKLISADNLKDKANAEDKPFPRDEPDQEDEPDAKEETDAEDETNSEDEDNTKDKKDPKDKSDPDDTDPKDSNAENNADTNNGSDPNGNAGPTSGTDSNSDGDTNNGTDPSSEPDPNVDNSTNNYSNSKYSTDPEDTTHTNNSDNAFVLGNNVDQDNITYSSDDTNPNYISGLQNGTDLDCTSGSNNGTGPNNTIEPNNEICYNIVPGSQNIKLAPNRFDPNIIPSSSDKDSFPKREHDFNVRQINATKHNNAISPNNDAGPNYVTRSISTADHDYAVVPNYDSDLVYIPGFTHTLGSSFVVNLNYDGRLNTTASTVNTTDTSDTSSSRGAFNLNYTAGMDYGSNTNHIPRFTHFIGFNFVLNLNYEAINTQNVNNSTNTSNINSILPEPELEISSSSSMPNIIFGNTPTFSAGTNNTSTPDNVTTSKAFNDYRFGAHFKDFAGSMNSVSFKYATKSKDALDAKESGFLKAFSRVQSPTGIKNPDILNFHFNPNISLPKLGIIGEAESPDVVKFDISSGAINQLLKLNHQTGSRQNLGP